MPESTNSSGVYVEELLAGPRPISGVSTSVALFIGRTAQGELNRPMLCRSIADFEQAFSADATHGELPHQVGLFFLNGGVKCYVIRIDANPQAATPGEMSAAPGLAEYETAFRIAISEVDLYNLMILPRDSIPALSMSDVYGPASVYCRRKHAFLLMEAPAVWADAQTALSNVDSLRVGLKNDYAALFFPDVLINDGAGHIAIGPGGAIAGLIARIDQSRGVWKAPAGRDASLVGVVGLQQAFSRHENSAMNRRSINLIRQFPAGILSWGARTMAGNGRFASEYKYIPVRRLASYIEASLERSLRWAVFEPNDEPLWAQIRLSVHQFMDALYRKGAFQGVRPGEAYYVKCDRETITQADQRTGVINVVVGFAPIRPAEFIVLKMQLAAQQV